ncbi:MAG: thiamine-phosphate kinase [Deltaproteobacteria bacterium]|nr:thiamine-phosphate kinase [Deltaproteobacteria bacterium]
MNLRDIGEFGFIKRISRGCLIRPHNVIKAIGDDAAAFIPAPGQVILVTTDLLVERIHFLREATSGFNLGYKALSVNLSDIAAMGGIAREAFISIAVPENCSIEYLEDLYNGIKTLAAEFDVNLLGGDTTRSKADLTINVSLVGYAFEKEILYRNTAQHGDIICTTGFLGDSRAGLYLIINDIKADSNELKALLNAHLLPKPYLREGRFLARQGGVRAVIDVSDGLSSDIGHIAEESNVGIRLYSAKIPVSNNLIKFCAWFDFDPVEYALAGGEDYTLLYTISPDKADHVAADYLKRFRNPLYQIGEITDSGKMELILSNGRIRSFTPSGWDHFKYE